MLRYDPNLTSGIIHVSYDDSKGIAFKVDDMKEGGSALPQEVAVAIDEAIPIDEALATTFKPSL